MILHDEVGDSETETDSLKKRGSELEREGGREGEYARRG